MNRLDEMNALEAAAAPRPWSVGRMSRGLRTAFKQAYLDSIDGVEEGWPFVSKDDESSEVPANGEDAAFIAAMREAAPKVIELVETVKAWLDAPHLVWFGPDRFTLRHPLSCPIDQCRVHDAVEGHTDFGPPNEVGYWECSEHDGSLVLGEYLGIDRPANPRDALAATLAYWIEETP